MAQSFSLESGAAKNVRRLSWPPCGFLGRSLFGYVLVRGRSQPRKRMPLAKLPVLDPKRTLGPLTHSPRCKDGGGCSFGQPCEAQALDPCLAILRPAQGKEGPEQGDPHRG